MRLLIFLLVCFPAILSAEVYRYVDDTGTPMYVTDLKDIPAKYQDQVNKPHELPKINKSEYKLKNSTKTESKKGFFDFFKKDKKTPQVELYVTSWCPYCKKAESFMKKHNIPYSRYDIERNATGRQKHSAAGGGGVPVFKIGDKIIRGFNEALLKQEFGF